MCEINNQTCIRQGIIFNVLQKPIREKNLKNTIYIHTHIFIYILTSKFWRVKVGPWWGWRSAQMP